MLRTDEVLSFAESIIYGYTQDWGESFTQREVDGFFYNQFLNAPLLSAIREARNLGLGREDVPYPCL